jgi:hypothetical protein
VRLVDPQLVEAAGVLSERDIRFPATHAHGVR